MNGKVLACVVKGELVVKLPAERVDALAEQGQGERFDPGMGRVKREWIALEPDDGCPALASESRAYVTALAGR